MSTKKQTARKLRKFVVVSTACDKHMTKEGALKAILLTEGDAKREILRWIDASRRVDIAVAWAGKGEIAEKLAKQPQKLRHIVIGTHLYQTAPHVLRALMPFPAAKYMPPNGRLFHPKVYLFDLGAELVAIVGSYNMTASAFDGRNIEAALLVRGAKNNATLVALADFVQSAWQEALRIDEEFLFSYEPQYKRNLRTRQSLEEFRKLARPRFAAVADSPLHWSWNAYTEKIRAEVIHDLEGRLRVLQKAAEIFTARLSFISMTAMERKAITGTYGKSEPTLDELDWGWFGNMFGHGDFKNLVNRPSPKLSQAIDQIPLTGAVTEDQYRLFVEAFLLAFKGKSHQGGVATASRLLAMKRPDTFVCIDNANRKALCDAYGIAHSTLSLNNYWDRVVEPVQLSRWWQRPRPGSGLHRKIWDNRAALLDCVFYEPR